MAGEKMSDLKTAGGFTGGGMRFWIEDDIGNTSGDGRSLSDWLISSVAWDTGSTALIINPFSAEAENHQVNGSGAGLLHSSLTGSYTLTFSTSSISGDPTLFQYGSFPSNLDTNLLFQSVNQSGTNTRVFTANCTYNDTFNGNKVATGMTVTVVDNWS